MVERYVTVESITGFLRELAWGSVADWFVGAATVVAICVALKGYRFAEWQRQQGLKDDRRKHVHMLGSKLAEMANDAWAIAGHFKECLERVAPSNGPLPRVFPLIGDVPPDRFALTIEENAILIESNNSEFLMAYVEAVRAQIIIHRTMEEYRQRYENLRSLLPAPVMVHGLAQTYSVNKEQERTILSFSNVLNDVLANVAEIIRDQTERCSKLSKDYHKIFKASFPDEKFIGIEMPTPPEIPPIARQPGWADLKR